MHPLHPQTHVWCLQYPTPSNRDMPIGVQQGRISKNRGIIIIKKNREQQMNEANIKQPKPCYLFQSMGLDARMGQNESQMGFKEKSRYECQYLI